MKIHLHGNQCCHFVTRWINHGAYEIKAQIESTDKFSRVTCKVCLKMVADIKTRMRRAKRRMS